MARQRHRSDIVAGELVLAGLVTYAAWQTPTWRPWLIAAGLACTTAAVMAAVSKLAVCRTGRSATQLQGMDPSEFEQLVARVLRQRGWTNVQVSGGPGDLQADVTGTTPDGRYGVVQAKAYTGPVGSPAVQMLLSARAVHGADVLMLATSSRFTRPAQDLARTHDVELVDGATLARELR